MDQERRWSGRSRDSNITRSENMDRIGGKKGGEEKENQGSNEEHIQLLHGIAPSASILFGQVAFPSLH